MLKNKKTFKKQQYINLQTNIFFFFYNENKATVFREQAQILTADCGFNFQEEMPVIWNENSQTPYDEENNTRCTTLGPISPDKSLMWAFWESNLSSVLTDELVFKSLKCRKKSPWKGRTFVIKWFCIEEKSAQSTAYWFQTLGLDISGFVGDWWCLPLIREVIHQGFIFQYFRWFWHTVSIHF